MQREEFCALTGCDVSRESFEKLELYHALLLKWQRAVNLVSPKTLDDAWVRHFADSAQLAQYIPDGAAVVDLGSGGGFPALAVAILRPDLEMHLIESDQKKAQFLKNVSRETFVDAQVHCGRVEVVLEGLNPDFVTARAFASTGRILDYMAPALAAQPDVELLLMKGRSWRDEVDEARGLYDFTLETYESACDSEARILHLTAVSKVL